MNNKICIGAGLVCLDILINNDNRRPLSYYVGGTCGNVMTILSFMGWTSYPIARLDDTKYTTRLIDDLRRNNVKIDYVSTNDGSTPVIIQRNIVDKNGIPTHKFEIKNNNGRFFLNFSSLTIKQADKIIESITYVPNVFFFDRISPAIIKLAKYFKNKGSIIFFEPSSKNIDRNFFECVKISDIIKFAEQRIKDLGFTSDYNNKLFIQTLGSEGLMFKFNNFDWRQISGIKNLSVVDTSGAGDWTTSIFINQIFSNDVDSVENLTLEFIENSLILSQKYAALSCSYEGARGMMSIKLEEIKNIVYSIGSEIK